MKQDYRIRRIETATPALQTLMSLSDAYMGALYPAESNHLEKIQALLVPEAMMLGVFADTQLVGCGAVRIMHDDGVYGEIKRVYVLESHRGQGLSKALMQKLEQHLLQSGVNLVRLETGVKQPEAIGLYRRLGYIECAAFGKYRPDPLSLFMEKMLAR